MYSGKPDFLCANDIQCGTSTQRPAYEVVVQIFVGEQPNNRLGSSVLGFATSQKAGSETGRIKVLFGALSQRHPLSPLHR
jgi:hypothetical protein